MFFFQLPCKNFSPKGPISKLVTRKEFACHLTTLFTTCVAWGETMQSWMNGSMDSHRRHSHRHLHGVLVESLTERTRRLEHGKQALFGERMVHNKNRNPTSPSSLTTSATYFGDVDMPVTNCQQSPQRQRRWGKSRSAALHGWPIVAAWRIAGAASHDLLRPISKNLRPQLISTSPWCPHPVLLSGSITTAVYLIMNSTCLVSALLTNEVRGY